MDFILIERISWVGAFFAKKPLMNNQYKISHEGNMTKVSFSALFLVSVFSLAGNGYCEDSGSGFGPVKAFQLQPLNPSQAALGKAVFQAKCSACHKMEERYVGPALKGVTTRRKPEWIMNMALNPQEMIQKDPTASKLYEEFLVPMTFQNVSESEVRSILEYFRSYDSGKEATGAKVEIPKKAKKK